MIGGTRAMREALAQFVVELDKVMLTVTDREDHVKGDVNEVRLPDGTVMEEADVSRSGGEVPRDNGSRPGGRRAALRNALARLCLILDSMDMPYRYEPINDGFVLLAGKAQVRRARKWLSTRELKQLPISPSEAVGFLYEEASYHGLSGSQRMATTFRNVAETLSRLAEVALPNRDAAEPSALGPRDPWGWVCRPHESEGLQHQSFNSMVRDLLNHMSISRYADAPCEVQMCRPFDKVTK